MHSDLLHVFTARANPLRWRAPDALYQKFARHMLQSGVHLHVVECQYGDRPFTCEMDGVDHIGVRARTMIWNKECLLNLGIRRVPQARYIAWIDADIMFRRPDWAAETVHALQLYDVVQPWSTAYDLGPNDEHMAVHQSFARILQDGGPVSPRGKKFWQGDGGPYAYPHSGYAWAMTRQAFDWLGGLFDVGGMGSGDYHMAQALAGRAECTLPEGTHPNYRRHVMRWQERAQRHINGNVGCLPGTIEHGFHGAKQRRNYVGRWDMFLKHAFDPDEDLKLNSFGVCELSGNKPALRRDFDRYLRHRAEDQNVLQT
jgi:hypothetical protein